MNIGQISKTVEACINNGERLLEDCEFLFEDSRYPTAKALAILAQEEFAKAYILRLVIKGAIPWSNELLKATRIHTCKQLMGVVMKYLFVSWEELTGPLQENDDIVLPIQIADSLNIICHEKILNSGFEDDDFKYDKQAKKISSGKIDKIKQNAIYVSISKDGAIESFPESYAEEVEKEREYAKILNEVARDMAAFKKERYIVDGLKAIFGTEAANRAARGKIS